MTEQNYLSNSLLTVARQLQKAEYIRSNEQKNLIIYKVFY